MKLSDEEIIALEAMTECCAMWWVDYVPAQETIGIQNDIELARNAIQKLKTSQGE